MSGVPQYLLIGNGRVSRHFQHYLTKLNIPWLSWSRDQTLTLLKEHLSLVSHVLILISDHAIETFVEKYLQKCNALRVHFSGSLVTSYAYGVHPLMTFNQQLYPLACYQSIPFIIDEDAPDFASLLPGLPNPHARLAKKNKSKYHALCVLSGNFSCLLWQKLFKAFKNEFNLEPQLAYPYLQQQMENLLHDYENALTGPLVRGDVQTLQKNIEALASDVFQPVYESFVSCYHQKKSEV